MNAPSPSPPTAPESERIHQRVEAELVRTAFQDAIYGAPFGIVVALMFAYAIHAAFPAQHVGLWLTFALACNLLRLLSRWAYLRQPVPFAKTAFWRGEFTVVSALTGLSWGVAAWIFYTPHDSIFRVMIVLIIAGLTTGASRLLAPVALANLSYVYLAISPLLVRILLNEDTRSGILGVMCIVYLAYMSVAARQQIATLRRTIRLGFENAALVESLGTAKEGADRLNRELSAEIARREIVEQELRAASERALAGSRAKSEFLATMSHEIRTPMNGIIGMLRIVHDSPLNPTQREQIETAAASADTLLDLLSDLLDFSKIEAGHLALEQIAFSPSTVTQSVTDLLRPRCSAKGLGLEVSLDPNLPARAIGDPTRIRQVLFNLVGNAIKFTPRGRVEVVVQTAQQSPQAIVLRVTVSDTGIGMDAESLTRLFRPFSQADSSMSRRFGGTGLGLAICKKLVEAMQGTIEVRSTPGSGSTFEVNLPLQIAPIGAAPQPAPAFVMPALQGRVLVVEDERVNQRVIAHFLQRLGLEKGLAEDGLAAVEMAVAQPWDAVLMDCQLPGIDGLEATRRIRTRINGRRLPIIALTANASTEDREACLAAGMDDFLTKPVRAELLAASLQKWLNESGS